MSGLLSHFASATLLLHMLLGCCWHHGHACHHRLSPAPVGQRSDDCGEGAICGQQHSGGHGSPAGEEHHGGQCQGSRCVFTAAGRFAAALQTQILYAAPAAALASETETALPVAVSGSDARTLVGPCPPLRLHLVNQVLLL